ncbi:toxic anion resistance protein [Pradoshia sp. D12]|uniref:toxic anion resistance protein n=1 Tax=Bacillaceae TaxID=186817 RepID=UPI00080AF72C|nr:MULTISPECIES: toxic anion resistance protein [Bacillaceae]OCA86962.1 hypothetical protein A8L44_06815 [Bacillus sp. FJAT-27986]QFK71261.1 toxic anion resistance protein [Pradoshia sp. D12]TPF73054.1 toxic anion resistance protein [Bacillus sp. D12]
MSEQNREFDETAIQSFINPEDMKKLNDEATQVVKKISDTDAHNIDSVLEHLSNFGGNEQRMAGESLNSLRRPVKDMMDNKDNHDIPTNLLKLREAVSDLNPNAYQTKGIAKIVPKFLRKSSNEKFIAKYQTVEKNIDEIVQSLLRGRDMLQEDNAELDVIKKDVHEKIYLLDKQIYMGQHLFQMIEDKKNDPEWQNKQQLVMEAQEKIIVRTKNMSSMVNVLQQSLASVDIIKKNNDKLKEAIRNAIDTTKNLAPVTSAIHLALQNQERIITAINDVNEATENMILANAQMLKENTEKTTKLLENPSISIEKLQKAYQDIYSAIETQEASSRRIIASSKEFVTKLDDMNREMKTKLLNQ